LRASDIVNQLASSLPIYADDFTDQISVSSLTRSGTTVTVSCSANHGLSVGEQVFITGAQTPISIASLTRTGTIARIVTDSDHDITLNAGFDVQTSGFNESEFNGTFVLSNVPNRRTIDFVVADSGPTTGTGTGLLLNGSSPLQQYNGLKEVTTIVSLTDFEYEISDSSLFTPAAGTIVVKSLPRISSAISYDLIERAYTKQDSGKGWLFVVLGDAVADKNRNINTDSVDNLQVGNFFNQRLIQAVHLYLVLPAADETAGSSSRDRSEELLKPICQSILSYRFPSLVENSNNPLMITGHGAQAYTGPYYVHQYTFEATLQMGLSDIYQPDDHVAFRDISFTGKFDHGTGEDGVTADIDLDDQIL